MDDMGLRLVLALSLSGIARQKLYDKCEETRNLLTVDHKVDFYTVEHLDPQELAVLARGAHCYFAGLCNSLQNQHPYSFTDSPNSREKLIKIYSNELYYLSSLLDLMTYPGETNFLRRDSIVQLYFAILYVCDEFRRFAIRYDLVSPEMEIK